MRTSIMIAAFLVAKIGMAQVIVGPTVECRFAAFERNGTVAIDEAVVYTTTPGGFVEGDFEPYEIRISSGATAFEVSVRLDGKLISRLNFPLVQIGDMPIGATVFGISFSTHKVTDGLDSIQYECRKVL